MLTEAWKGFWAAWDRFWFAPQSTSTLALVRIAFGVVITCWTVSLFPDLTALYSDVGVAPQQIGWQTPLTLLAWWSAPPVVAGLWAVLLGAAVCLTLGYQSRIAAVVVFVAVLSFQQRSPDTLNSGDVLLRLIALYLVFAPTGAALSIDRWRKHRETFWGFPHRSPWPLRLIQVQMSVVYAASVFYKLQGINWVDGTALGYALGLTDLRRLPVPEFFTDQLLLLNLATYGTLVVEAALALLVWNRRAMPWVLAAGVVLHLGIDLTIMVGFFSFAMFVTYIAFVPPEVAERWIHAVRRRLEQRWGAARPAAEAASPALAAEERSHPDPVA